MTSKGRAVVRPENLGVTRGPVAKQRAPQWSPWAPPASAATGQSQCRQVYK